MDLVKIHQISPTLYGTAGMTDENFVMVYCDCEGAVSASGNEGTETIETLLVSREDAKDLLRGTETKFDVKLWLELSKFVDKEK